MKSRCRNFILLVFIVFVFFTFGCDKNGNGSNDTVPTIEGYLPLVIEVFSHVNCANCLAADSAVYTVRNHYAQTQSKIPIIWEIHSRFLGNDPFYTLNSADVDARTTYYFGITNPNLPQVIVGGMQLSDPQDPDLILAICDSALALSRPAAITMSVDTTSDSLRLSGQISSSQDCAGYFVCVILYHKATFESAPGSNGLKEFRWVVADFIPSGNGQFMSVPAGGSIDFSYSAPFPQIPAGSTIDSLFVAGLYQSTDKTALAVLPPIKL